MRPVKLKNNRLIARLSDLTEIFYSDVYKKIISNCKEQKDHLITKFHPTSDEYLFECFKLKLDECGWPRAFKGQNFNSQNISAKEIAEYENTINKISKIGLVLGVQRGALSMAYPDGGYIGWHHNGNAPGHNVLFSYSQDGDGGFSYWDYKTKSIKTIKDEPGWNVKVGYYPSQIREPDKVYWHMAKTAKQRVSIAFVIDQKEMWKNMIEDITMGDYDSTIFE